MGTSNFDPKMISLFKQEAQNHVVKVNNLLLSIEKDIKNKELLSKVKSEVHTLKGDAHMMGLKNISDAAHALEDLFELLIYDKKESSKNLFKNIYNVVDCISEAADKLPEIISINIEKLLSDGKEKKKESVEIFIEEPIKETKKEKLLSKPETKKEEISEYIQLNLDKIEDILAVSSNIISYHGRFSFILDKLNDLKNILQNKILDEEINKNIDSIIYNFSHELTFYELLALQFQNDIIQLKLVRLSTIFELFPRLVHDIALRTNKEVSFIIEGKDVELDKFLVEKLKSILIHILRNAVDHGCETETERKKKGKSMTNTVILKAYNKGDTVCIEISDDGAGLDAEKIKEKAIEKGLINKDSAASLSQDDIYSLIFKPGFSTKEVGEFSGRGVGMDVVAGIIKELNGEIDVQTNLNKGTSFTINVPLISSFIPVTIFSVKDTLYSIPSLYVSLVAYAKEEDIKYIGNSLGTMSINNTETTLVDFYNFINPDSYDNYISDKNKCILFVAYQDEITGFIVSSVIQEKRMVIKKIHGMTDKLQIIIGAVLGNEQAIPVLNIPMLFSLLKSRTGENVIKKIKKEKDHMQKIWQKVALLVEDSPLTRNMEKRILQQNSLYVMEASNGKEALAFLEKQNADVVITDIEMPVMNGIELIKNMKNNEKLSKIPVIVVSSYTAYKNEIIRMGIKYFLDKSDFKSEIIIKILKEENII